MKKQVKVELAKSIYRLQRGIDGLKDELEECRAELAAGMKAGEAVVIDTPEGPYRVKNMVIEQRIPEEPWVIEATAGLSVLLKSSTVSVTKLEAAIREIYEEVSVEGILKKCIKMVEKKTCLKLLRGAE